MYMVEQSRKFLGSILAMWEQGDLAVIECLFYYLNGYTAKEVAKVILVSHQTVEGYINNIKNKFDCSTRRELRLVFFPDQR